MKSLKKNLGWNKYEWLLDTHKSDCISHEEDKKCYEKPCACLVCLHEDRFCTYSDPCWDCNGEDNERRHEFCFPDD